MDTEAQREATCCELVESVVRRWGEARLKVTGSSMLPVVWPGDEITVSHSEYAELRTGHVILYRRNGRLIAHRIECVAQDQLIARGDSLLYLDPPVQPNEIVGRVVSILRRGRAIQLKRSVIDHICSLILRRSNVLRRVVLFVNSRLTQLYIRSLLQSGETQARWAKS
jgi:signal peptidase